MRFIQEQLLRGAVMPAVTTVAAARLALVRTTRTRSPLRSVT